jgi:O-antigen ligase
VGLWVVEMVMNRKIDIEPSSTYLPFIALIISSIFSFGFAQMPFYPIEAAPIDAQLGGVLIFLVSFLIFILAVNRIDDIKWLKWLTYSFLAICGIYLVLRFAPGGRSLSDRLVHYLVLAHGLFWCWLIVMSFSQAAFNNELSIIWRGVLMFICLMGLYVVLFDTRQWVSGWFPALIALVVAVWVAKPKLAYFLSLIVLAVGAFYFNDIVNNFIYVGDNAYSEMTRLEAWKIVFQIMSVNPVFGVGPANYSFYTPLFPILGWSVQFNSHNNYVDLIAQFGYLGLILVLWLFWEIGKVAARVRLLVSGSGFVPAFVYGTIGGFVATVISGMLGDWFFPYVYNITIRGMRASMLAWIFLGSLVALERILRKSAD